VSDPASVVKLYRSMNDQWLVDMKAAFTEDREANRTRGNAPGVKFCDGRLRLIALEQARRKKKAGPT
jgi:hypothetical protein